jgi:hypothetical protein
VLRRPVISWCIYRKAEPTRKGKSFEVTEATFPTFTEDPEELKAWLIRHRIKRVATESIGVYWRPVWNILEQPPGKLELLLLNPQHVKALPGRKTDRVAIRLRTNLQFSHRRRKDRNRFAAHNTKIANGLTH